MDAAIRFSTLLTALLAALPLPAAAQEPRRPPCATCIAVVVTPDQIELLPTVLNGLEILVELEPAEIATARLAMLVEGIEGRGGRPGVLVTGVPAEAAVPAVARLTAIVLDVRGSTLTPEALIFELRRGLTSLRANGAALLRLGVEPPPAMVPMFVERTAAGYWDFLVLSGAPPAAHPSWVRRGDLDDVGRALAETTAAAAERWLLRAPADAETARRTLADLAAAARFLVTGLVPGPNDVRITCGAAPTEIYLDPATLARVALLAGCDPETVVRTEPPAPVDRVQLSSGEAVVRVPESSGDRFASDVRVAAPRRLTVEEVIARHQAAAVRQAQEVRRLISSGTLTVSFEAPGFPAPVTVSSGTTIYRDGSRTDLEQRDIRVNGIAFRQGGVPRLPIIEPERAAAPPLVITLGDKYRYRLAGEETLADVPAYVVAFEPVTDREPLFRGRAWIAADDFGLVRVEAAQTGLRGPVVSSEQVDAFVRIADGVWALGRSDVRQLYQGAGYRTPITRVLMLSSHEPNASDFEQRRLAAYASPHTILRDTAAGYRYLEGDARRRAQSGEPAAEPGGPPSPEPASRASRVRTLAFGVIVDPNISRPLPFAGLSYLDFDLFGTGAQFNGFFGGAYGQLAFSLPSLRGSRWQVAGRAFGIASSYNDRAFVNGREQYDRNVRQRPASASVWLLRPVTPRLALRAGYDMDYTHYARSDATAPDFDAPADQLAHALRMAVEGQRWGWDATVWWSGSRRTGWRAWGRRGSGEYSAEHRDFQRYGASAARSFILSPRLVGRAEVSVVSGHDLDRFSRFSFGTFDNRLRGYPSALIRYDRGGTLRTALAWSAGRLLRLDAFADAAFVRDRGFGPGVSRFPGIGAAVEAPAPFGMLVAAEWGYGIQGVNADGRRGTQVVRVTGYKIF